MKLYFYRAPQGNFGDDINPWLWSRLFPRPLEQYFDEDTLFVGIGSILNHKIPSQPSKKIVFSSGHAYGDPPVMTEQWRLVCVRGPLTARALGLSERLAISDGAMLIRKLVEPGRHTIHRCAFMPHHVSARYDNWRPICEDLAIPYLDPGDPVEKTLATIRASALVITEAMHGAIVADTLRVPWIPVRTRPLIVDFKWRDWAQSVQIDHKFEWLPKVWNKNIDTRLKQFLHPAAARIGRARLSWLIRHGAPRLSDDTVFAEVYERLDAAFQQLLCEAEARL